MTISETELNKLIKKALKILRKNYSCPGPDNISYKLIKKEPLLHFSNIAKMFEQVVVGEEQFSIPRQVKIIDAFKKERIVYVYNIYDRVLQQCIKLLIESTCYSVLSKSVLSHRRGVNINNEFKKLYLSPNFNLLEFDIKDFFSSINKEILFNKLLTIGVSQSLVRSIKKSFFHSQNGIPAGNCLSPLLSDIYLLQFDENIMHPFVRFNDDYFINIRTDNMLLFMKNIVKLLKSIELEINPSKCKFNSQPVNHQFLI